ncbi:hydroxyacid dehydrogenase [Saccharopolyspora rhizosphaerae]|uniref:Hydroxyacid dehydrogenase n=1 Tax=Saccharopolyspora rhizosphaerae TaxID=2492662 RepID=A0A426K019_9PSEU|nr:2-hydroxyacid dehydrogenase [Saccharopolyspora rhizosphaerae]RRO18757.1 hydroxyacid dehydrogenase [Saccharopolyspora rhizosphaerae]
MTNVLAAGDHFVHPEVFVDALRRATERDLHFDTLKLPWPVEPFGPVGNVQEASGTEQRLLDALGAHEIVATQMAPFTGDVLNAAENLKFVGVCRGGPVNVDLQAATDNGVIVSYAPGRNAAAAAEFAVGLMLAALRRIPGSDAELKDGNWRGDYYAYENAGIELEGSTAGLVGYGAIGRIVARVLRAFGAKVLVADPFVSAADVADEGVELVELEDLLRRSSVVSLHARLTPETQHLLNADNLKLLPKGAVLVNSARGGLLDYAPLPDLLRAGKLGALAVDVYDIEPPPRDWPLFDAPNVITTPHLAGATRQTAHRAAEIVAGEVARFLDGRRPRFVANPDVLAQFEDLQP